MLRACAWQALEQGSCPLACEHWLYSHLDSNPYLCGNVPCLCQVSAGASCCRCC